MWGVYTENEYGRLPWRDRVRTAYIMWRNLPIKALHLDRRYYYYAKIGLSTNEVLETNMPKNILDRAVDAFLRNNKLLIQEVKERLEDENTTDTTEEN